MRRTSFVAVGIILAVLCVAGPSRVAAESVQDKREDICGSLTTPCLSSTRCCPVRGRRFGTQPAMGFSATEV